MKRLIKKLSRAADVIIVLGGGINGDGSLGESSRQRVDKGVELYKKRAAPYLIMSGKGGFLSETQLPFTEAEVMKKYAVTLGVDPKDVFLEEKSKDTIGNAYFTRKLSEDKKWKRFIVVTSDYHLKRSKYIFRKIFGREYTLHFIRARSYLNYKQRRMTKRREKEYLFLTKHYLKHIISGNLTQIESFIFHEHPAYSREPHRIKKELLKILF